MALQKIPYIPNETEIIDFAFKKASKKANIQYNSGTRMFIIESDMITAVTNYISKMLSYIVQSYPDLDGLSEFYTRLIDLTVGVDRLKVSLSRISTANKTIKKLSRGYIKDLKKRGTNREGIRKEFYGRSVSIINGLSNDLYFLNEARKKLNKIPDINLDEPIIIVTGYPNVGKSTVVNIISTGRPTIASYPFTTKEIVAGHFYNGRDRYQVVDVPGILDRPDSKRNNMEWLAFLAIEQVNSIILFILDLTETCGYTVTEQIKLLNEIKQNFDRPMITVANKTDIKRVDSDIVDISISAKTGDNISELMEKILLLVKKNNKNTKKRTIMNKV
ncbi:MAG: GTP-binding protein [Candidatus Methanoliparum thermophilum]|uniref:GTP-binding protein n=1 Tax=Methanoliparum thermophilum TaxID=2491083 RepID=A0A520KTN9_METT2|nr:MAG: GTP-binding protein [Candidatus Methanoliparum thermophilum]